MEKTDNKEATLDSEIKLENLQEIDHSPNILHVKQEGMQCWTRSSQMILSYILRKVGFSPKQTKEAFYDNVFLDYKDFINPEEYVNLNQRILGRKLREKEEPLTTLDDLVVKMYNEFGSTSFLAEVFPSFIKNYLQAFTRVTKKNLHATITLIIDNDNEEEIYKSEESCTVIYKTFPSYFGNGIETGLLKGKDKKFWESLDDSEKIKKLEELLQVSPILIESPGHAFVLSGILPSEGKFIVNDSLTDRTGVVSYKSLLKSISSLVLLAEITL